MQINNILSSAAHSSLNRGWSRNANGYQLASMLKQPSPIQFITIPVHCRTGEVNFILAVKSRLFMALFVECFLIDVEMTGTDLTYAQNVPNAVECQKLCQVTF